MCAFSGHAPCQAKSEGFKPVYTSILQQFFFPSVDLIGVNLKIKEQLVGRLLPLDGFSGHLGFELLVDLFSLYGDPFFNEQIYLSTLYHFQSHYIPNNADIQEDTIDVLIFDNFLGGDFRMVLNLS